ncbi:hypothetical protein NMG60_11025331 [Bertholletia excelsa]
MEGNSPKITIRPYKVSDADDFMIYGGDDRVTRLSRWNTFTSREESLAYIKDLCIPHPYCRSICLDDRSIGFLMITPGLGDERCRAEVRYALATEYWGCGIVAEALKIAMPEAVKEFPELVRLQAHAAAENKASQRVLEKLGFLREGLLRKYIYNKGELRDVIIYSLLVTDLIS